MTSTLYYNLLPLPWHVHLIFSPFRALFGSQEKFGVHLLLFFVQVFPVFPFQKAIIALIKWIEILREHVVSCVLSRQNPSSRSRLEYYKIINLLCSGFRIFFGQPLNIHSCDGFRHGELSAFERTAKRSELAKFPFRRWGINLIEGGKGSIDVPWNVVISPSAALKVLAEAEYRVSVAAQHFVRHFEPSRRRELN